LRDQLLPLKIKMWSFEIIINAERKHIVTEGKELILNRHLEKITRADIYNEPFIIFSAADHRTESKAN